MISLNLVIAFLIGVAVAGIVAYLIARSMAARDAEAARLQVRFARERGDDLERRLTAKQAIIEARDASLSDAQREVTRRTAEEATFAARLDELNRAHQMLRDSFRSLSSEALRSNNESFLQLARTEFEKLQQASQWDLAARETAIDGMLGPIRDGLAKYDAKIIEIERERLQSFATLDAQLAHMSATSETLRVETASLAGALRSSNVRGMWGEVQLQRCCELAGMLEYCDFRVQESVSTEEGRRRPDLTIQLPGGKTIVVDAKVPLTAYMEATACEDRERQLVLLKQHAACVRGHVEALRKKAYWDQFDCAPEFVVLFLPAESFLSAALAGEPALLEEGIRERVIIATPTTLIALLKAVAFGWRQERIAVSAERISVLGKELYERLSTLAEHFNNVGTHLRKSVIAFNRAVGSLEHRVLISARRFGDYGVPVDSPIRELSLIEAEPSPLSAPELQVVASGALSG